MLFSETKKYRVISTDTATTVGVLDGFIVDPRTATIVAVSVKKSDGPGDTVHWDDLTAFGTDVITVPSAQVLTDATGRAADLAAGDADILGKRLLTDAGVEIGTVADVEFNPEDGTITALITKDDDHIAGTRLVGAGSYAVIVKEA